MASVSAPASGLAVQLPAPASSLAVPPPAASTAEALYLWVGAAILEDPGPAAGVAGAASTHQFFIFSSLLLFYCSCLLAFWSYFEGISCVCTRTRVQILSCTRYSSIVFIVVPAWVCSLVCLVELDGCKHENTIIPRLHPVTRDLLHNVPGMPRRYCLIWLFYKLYDTSAPGVRNIGTREAFMHEAASIVWSIYYI